MQHELDLVGVGFGPAGIALAAAIEDYYERHPDQERWNVRFLDQQSGPAWQGGLLLRGTDINHHFLRDFATPRDPRSRFTFTNYLKERGRLFHFGHLGGKVSRIEWADYVRWTAEQLSPYVSYDTRVLSIEPGLSPGGNGQLRLRTSNGEVTTAAVALNSGPVVNIPDQFRPFLGERFFHTSRVFPLTDALDRAARLSFCIVGSGQSAGEVINYLYGEFPNSVIHSVHRSVGFKQVDLCHFSNEAYFPAEVDYFYSLESRHRALVAQDLKLTNYSSIDMEVSQPMYWRMYEDRVLGTQRIHMLSRRRIVDIEMSRGAYDLTFADVYTEQPSRISADVVIVCTGYREDVFPPLLEPLRSLVQLDDQGGPLVSYDYEVQTVEGFRPRVYLNGLSERTHGISDSASFSMMAIKAERMLSSMRANGTLPQCRAAGDGRRQRMAVEA